MEKVLNKTCLPDPNLKATSTANLPPTFVSTLTSNSNSTKTSPSSPPVCLLDNVLPFTEKDDNVNRSTPVAAHVDQNTLVRETRKSFTRSTAVECSCTTDDDDDEDDMLSANVTATLDAATSTTTAQIIVSKEAKNSQSGNNVIRKLSEASNENSNNTLSANLKDLELSTIPSTSQLHRKTSSQAELSECLKENLILKIENELPQGKNVIISLPTSLKEPEEIKVTKIKIKKTTSASFQSSLSSLQMTTVEKIDDNNHQILAITSTSVQANSTNPVNTSSFRRPSLKFTKSPPLLKPLSSPSPPRAEGDGGKNRDGDHHHHHHHHHHPQTPGEGGSGNILVTSRTAYGSLNSDVSATSSVNSSLSSLDSLLEQRRENPEEVLMALGFGGVGYGGTFGNGFGAGFGAGFGGGSGSFGILDPLLRIPGRFFEQPSSARGVDVHDLLLLLYGRRESPVAAASRRERFSSRTNSCGLQATHFNCSQQAFFSSQRQTPQQSNSAAGGNEVGGNFYYPLYYPYSSYQQTFPPETSTSGFARTISDHYCLRNNSDGSVQTKPSPTTSSKGGKSEGDKNQPKVLVMGPKCYHFDSDDIELYSPKTSSIHDPFEVPPSFATPLSVLLSPPSPRPRRASSVGNFCCLRSPRSPPVTFTSLSPRSTRSPSFARSPAASVSITSDFSGIGGGDEGDGEESDDEDDDDNFASSSSARKRKNRSNSSQFLAVPGSHFYIPSLDESRAQPSTSRADSHAHYRKLSCPNIELVYRKSSTNSSTTPIEQGSSCSQMSEHVKASKTKSYNFEKQHQDEEDEVQQTNNDQDPNNLNNYDHENNCHALCDCPKKPRSSSVDIQRATITYYPPTLNESLAKRLKPLLAELSSQNSLSGVSPSNRQGTFNSCDYFSGQTSSENEGLRNSYHHLSTFIETALVSTIESLKLSLDFYRYFTLQHQRQQQQQTFEFDRKSEDNVGKLSLKSESSNPDRQKMLSTPSETPVNSRGRSRSLVAFEIDRQQLSLQNLYLEVLEVETMLYDCLHRFKHHSALLDVQSQPKSANKNIDHLWTQQQLTFDPSYIGQLEEAVEKISAIQQSLRSLGTNYHRSLANVHLETSL